MHSKKHTNKHPTEREQRIYKFLKHNPVGVLSTIDPDNNPHGVVLYFSITPDFHIRFLTRDGTRKCDNLHHSPHAMLTVFDSESQSTAQVMGSATEITDHETINEVARTTLEANLTTSENKIPPITKLEEGSYVAFEITPVQIRMARYGQPKSGDFTKMFESLESFELTKP